MIEFLQGYADKLLFLLAAALLFIPLEHFLPRQKEKKIVRKNLLTDTLYAFHGRSGGHHSGNIDCYLF